jgi:predicted phosphoadenosine phosphosulfate sulfurtransferase
MKRGLKIDVLTAARIRVARVFDDFNRIYVSFSGGKDSGVLTELAAVEARRRGRRIGVLIVDLEAQYRLTIDYIQQMLDRHSDVLEPYWVALPLNLRNAVSHFEPQWMCWDPDRRGDWVRQPPPHAITDETHFPFFRRRMEFEEFVPAFGEWYGEGKHLTACMVGIRADESLNRWRSIARRDKRTYEGLPWTTFVPPCTYNVYPIYDWRTEDIWTYYAREQVPYNRLYDRMHQAGLSIHQARICQPYGDDQRRGLWLYSVIEPETWARVVARVNGANFGAAHARTSGNILGNIKVTKPDHLTWQEFANVLLDSLPPNIAEHYRTKIAVFLRYYQLRGYDDGIPDEGPPNQRGRPSWTRICRALLRFDYHCKGLSFSPNKPDGYVRYLQRMKQRRQEWQLI